MGHRYREGSLRPLPLAPRRGSSPLLPASAAHAMPKSAAAAGAAAGGEPVPIIRLSNGQASDSENEDGEEPSVTPATAKYDSDALSALPDDSAFRCFLKLGNTRRRHSWNVW